MTPLQILTSARAKIEQGWCQGSLARNADGKRTGERASDAICWCAIGACWANADTSNLAACEVIRQATDKLSDAVGARAINIWNDSPTRTKAEVLAAFDRAIELASEAA